MAAAVAQYITVVDKSNKVVGTTKQLKNVFKEAKSAYLEKKAEIQADRKVKEDRELHKARRAVEAMTIAESDAASRSSRHSSRHRSHRSRDYNRRPALPDRHRSARSIQSGHSSRSSFSESPRHSSRESSRSPRTPLGQFHEQLQNSRSAPPSPLSPRRQSNELVRRRTDSLALTTQQPRPLSRSYSAADLDHNIDMDLAYGEFHPESLGLALDPAVEEKLQKQELSSLVLKAKMLLDEANCAQHSVKAIIAHLQKNPDAMAAVALTLAEISNIASKMAPGALGMLAKSAPAVFAMLAAPEFLIAVGVGVGITVVMFGGYKIIKKIKARAGKDDASMDEAIEVEELDRIEHWRRGIADADATETGSVISTATSVEGEYITPMAARSMGHLSQPESTKDRKSREKTEKKDRKDREKSDKKEKKKHRRRESSDARSEASTSSKRSTKLLEAPKEFGRNLIDVKKPSPLRAMFRSNDTNSATS